jgi:hypothetical protein
MSHMKAEGLSRSWSSGVVAALLGCGVCAAWGQAVSWKKALVGRPAPSFQLQGIYGETYSLDQFKGHILVMQFGSSW